jgi:hypothetical protein
MSLVIRRADLTSDRNTIIDILNRNIPTRQHAAIYEWLYQNNPYGPAETWLAVNSNTGAAVGTASVFPRPVMLNRKSIPGGLVGDFAIDAGFRSLGPAVLLQKETITPVSEGRMAITFDAPPDERGMSTFRRMGIPAVGRMLRFAKPIMVDSRIPPVLGEGPLARGVIALGNGILRLRDRTKKSFMNNFEFRLHPGEFGDEFTQLEEKICHQYKIYCRRSAEYLNWRYRADPVNEYEVHVSHGATGLQAYAIYREDQKNAYLVDIFGDIDALRGLLVYSSGIMRKQAVRMIFATVFEGSSIVPVLKNCGFYFREESHFFVPYLSASEEDRRVAMQKNNWHIAYGDIIP